MNNNTRVENLLTQIYSQVDLKDDVFEYLQPYVLKAYGLLRSDQLNIENGKANAVLFQDPEHKNAIENILFRDLPGFIDIYTQLPLDYRNEKIVKGNKTHRDLLIENVEILSRQLKGIEHSAYEIYDQRMSVSNRFIKERYNSPDFTNISATEVEPESTIQNKFSWNTFKESLGNKTMQSIIGRDFTKETDNNRKIVLNENQIEYKVKDKMRHFMSGTYQVYQKMSENLKKAGSWLGENWGGVVCIASAISVLVIPISLLIYQTVQEVPARDLNRTATMINTSNAELRDISMKVLNQFAQENKLEVRYTPDKEAVFIYKDVSKTQCIHAIEYYQYKNTQITGYSINGMPLDSNKIINNQLQEGVCNLETNKLSVGWSLKMNGK